MCYSSPLTNPKKSTETTNVRETYDSDHGATNEHLPPRIRGTGPDVPASTKPVESGKCGLTSHVENTSREGPKHEFEIHISEDEIGIK